MILCAINRFVEQKNIDFGNQLLLVFEVFVGFDSLDSNEDHNCPQVVLLFNYL
jgi:hypothetical protein